MNSVTSLVVLDRVGLEIGSVRILDGVDLEIGAGETVGLAGINGSGKTTLLSILATLRQPTRGSATILGADTTDHEAVRAVRPSIGLSGHEPALYDDLTLTENLAHFARLSGRPPESVDRSLSAVGLSRVAARRARDCSEGMRRRADLARLVAARPTLLLLDEAHAGLDREAREIVDWLCTRTTDDGGGCVVVAHEPERLATTATRIVTLDRGRVGT